MNTGNHIKLISHRGNINGCNPKLENTPDYIKDAIHLGYDVEIDIWYSNNTLWLGHDNPEYQIDLHFLLENANKLWVHCKNFEALSHLLKEESLKLFYHKKEEYTIISNNLIWAHNISNVNEKCIIPLLSKNDVKNWKPTKVYGVCSDYIDLVKKL